MKLNQDIRICFVGDSLVNGACDETYLGWTGRLCASANLLGVPVTYYNLGVRGNTSKDILDRWKNECSYRLPDSCDGRIVISCGINDTVILNGSSRIAPKVSVGNLRSIISNSGSYKVIVVGPPPVVDIEHNKRIESLSNDYRRLAQDFDIPYIDIYFPLKADPLYKQDIVENDKCYPQGYHPTSKGYEKIADIVRNSIDWWF